MSVESISGGQVDCQRVLGEELLVGGTFGHSCDVGIGHSPEFGQHGAGGGSAASVFGGDFLGVLEVVGDQLSIFAEVDSCGRGDGFVVSGAECGLGGGIEGNRAVEQPATLYDDVRVGGV